MELKFSHNYPKLHGQTNANLVCMIKMARGDLKNDFIEYDTFFKDQNGHTGYFNLPDDYYIVLVYVGNKLIPFTTVRRYTDEKWNYYKQNMRKWFKIVHRSPDA